jgi:hypothetical protein
VFYFVKNAQRIFALPNEAVPAQLPDMGCVLMRAPISFWLAVALAVVGAAELDAQGFLIPHTNRVSFGITTMEPPERFRDMVFDSARQNLYISTSTGLILTFHLSTLTFGTSYDLGGSLNGIDIARDNSFLLVAQSQGSTFQRVNIASGMITNVNYTRAFGETGAWDVAIGSNGLALVTTQYNGSGWTPLRQINLSTNAITIRSDAPGSGPGGQVRQDTQIHRSADGTRFFFMESNISSGPVFTYSATSNTFGSSFDTNAFLDVASGAVNRNGDLIAFRTYGTPASLKTAPNFDFVHSFNGIDSGVAFDAIRDIMYGVNSATDEIVVYSTTTFAQLFRGPIGEDIGPGATQFGTGTLVASADGGWLALETDSGIRLFQVPNVTHPTDFNLDGKPDYLLYNASTRQTAVWYLNNNVYIGGTYAPTLPVAWRVIDVADFNRDGRPDYALFNVSTRQTAIWYLSGGTYVGGAYGPTLPSGWTLVAAGDFNTDGKPDYVLFNASTRQTAVWYLNNNVYIGGAYGPSIPAPWSLAGIADFNGDRKPDYLLFNPSTLYSVIWYLSGTTRIGSAFGPTIAAGYNLTGTADFNRDFRPDYVLFNASTRESLIWYLNNNVYVNSANGPTLSAGWSLVKP